MDGNAEEPVECVVDWPVEVLIDDASRKSPDMVSSSMRQQLETSTDAPGADVTEGAGDGSWAESTGAKRAGASGEFPRCKKIKTEDDAAYKDGATNTTRTTAHDDPLMPTDLDKSTSCSTDSDDLVTSPSVSEHCDSTEDALIMKPFACSVCDFKAKRADHLKRHMKSHTDEKPYACSVCDFKSRRSDHLKRHMKSAHTSEMPYVCSLCCFKSKRSEHLKKHMRTHTGEKPYACDLCGFKTSNKNSSTLDEHLRVHACTFLASDDMMTSDDLRRIAEQPCECPVCGSVFGLAKHLNQHMRTHSDEKPFACDVCEYKSSEKGSLKKHMMTHTGEKPYSCNVCNYKCTQPSHLKRHMRSHTGEKPYACRVCDYKSSDPSHLKKHMKTHIGDMTYC